VLTARKYLIRRESIEQDSRMPALLDPATLPRNATALRALLLRSEAGHAAEREQQAVELAAQITELQAALADSQTTRAELQAARNGLQELTLIHEKLKLRLARLLRQQFGDSSKKLRAAINQLELLLEDVEEQIAELTPPEPEQPAAPATAKTEQRRKPVRRPLPDSLPRDVVEHPAPCPARSAVEPCGLSART
jgi:septal ring factor EnvC (AmiA/AmiB activator)